MTLPEQKMKLCLHIFNNVIYRDFFKSISDPLRLRIPQDSLKSCWAEQSLIFLFFFSCSIGKQDKIMLFVILKPVPISSVSTHVCTPSAAMPLLKAAHLLFSVPSPVSGELTQLRMHTGSEGSPCGLQNIQASLGSPGKKKINSNLYENNKVWSFITEAVWWISAPTHFSNLWVHPELTHLGSHLILIN